tara:strand:- start:919 stop:1305 length:387 start_codon:yes stop_codon:yes gene_type:complete
MQIKNMAYWKAKHGSPAKMHDGTKSSTTHYKDGSAKSEREVTFSKRHENEVSKTKEEFPPQKPNAPGPIEENANKWQPARPSDKEELLNQGFTQEDADHMIKEGAVTGRVKKAPKRSKDDSPSPKKNK